MKTAALLLAALVAVPLPAATASTPEFDRYQVILERKPFGDPPLAPEPQLAPPGPAAPPWADSFRLVSVTKVEGGDVRVGILDRRNNKPLLLKIGEMQEGIELLEASVEEESAQLRKDGETVTMNLREAAPGDRPPPPPPTSVPQPPPMGQPMPMPVPQPPMPQPGQPPLPPGMRPTIRAGAMPPASGAITPPTPAQIPGVIRPTYQPPPSP